MSRKESDLSRAELLKEIWRANERNGHYNILLTNAIAQHIGLSAVEFECYDLLREKGPLPAGRLAEYCGLSTGGVTGLVDRLERMGYAKRLPDPADRRRVLVSAEDDAIVRQKHGDLGKVIRGLYQPLSDEIDELVGQFTTAELRVLHRFLTQCNDILDSQTLEIGRKK